MVRGGEGVADLCLECFNKLNNTSLGMEDIELSFPNSLCDRCMEIRPIVIKIRKHKREKRKDFVMGISIFALIYTGFYVMLSLRWYLAVPLSILYFSCGIGLVYYYSKQN